MTRVYTEAQKIRRNELARLRYAKHPERYRAVVHALYVKHRAKRLAAAKRRYQTDPEKYKAKTRAYYQDHPGETTARYREKYPDRARANYRRWLAANPEKARAATKAWRLANPDRSRASNKRYQHKHSEDPKFMLNKHVRTLMAVALRRVGSTKNGRAWRSLVGYSLDELKAHIERNFLPGMSWGNRKLWHIDHIRPLVSFVFDGPDHPQFKKAWALKNLRPLWAQDNMRKNKRQPTTEEIRSVRMK